eukprot:SAG22_NODE_861_length_6818_cov_3.155850_2_plen_69_part_00
MSDMQREICAKFDQDQTDRKRQDWSVCVVDGDPWLAAWHKRFEALQIEWLPRGKIAVRPVKVSKHRVC